MSSARRAWRLEHALDLRLTLGPHRRGSGDPTMRLERHEVWRAVLTPEGAATLHLRVTSSRLEAEAWGPGSEWALDRAPKLIGAEDSPEALRPHSAELRALARRLPGLRIGSSELVLEALVPAILEQKVTGVQARRCFRNLVGAFGDRAPGPAALHLPPDPSRLAEQPYWALHPLGIERRRAELIRLVAARAAWLEECRLLPGPQAAARLEAFSGIGPWTVAEVAGRAWGDPDAVPVGDYHIPSLVSWVLAREPRADDRRMLEILKPYRGQRGRVIRLIEAGGDRPPRFGPRSRPSWIGSL